MSAMQCRRCNGPMAPGIYTQQTVNARGVTRYPCGPGRVAPCLKCVSCGHSVTTEHVAGPPSRPTILPAHAGSLCDSAHAEG